MELLKAEHFDFGITEIFSPCAYAIFGIIDLNNYATAFTSDLYEVVSDPLGEAVRKSTFALTNSEELLEFPRLDSHKVVFIGGIAVNTPKPLNKVKKFIMRFRTYANAINSRAHHAFCAIPSTERLPFNEIHCFAH
ncbi:unnamed protein product [Gongylonema pulchrum]|uniref:Glucuronosyltransferase n=1 Tax=Gongylonema pulchrum TaxID=637853 RepID=A0A183CXL6_9BILA|nr:unnamed protein product [Gongylonema pulchrum]